ncbi:LysR family transcriptional regulator [Neomicrococcus lactis]|uniref:DNA-binding transcriptional LysR family regulator n=1 Tax=Neomicrococcus lactis TaxID=732241 RepID=A0A7W8YC50_9MICC|nr:LysR family transcriptional regulator [Neomicrococcus lactis]MBB5598809.1 DNA-binding transcriptional LysR family regulator [Neomicrococcus lactis]
MLNPTHLQTLVEVVRLGSFTAAGNRLGYTASAVSQQMVALEKTLGVKLFIRSARSVQPTNAAQALGRSAVKVLKELDELLALGQSVNGLASRTLRLGAFPSVATFVLPRILESPAWIATEASLKLHIGEPSQVVPSLRAGGDLDAALVYHVGEAGLALPRGVQKHWLGEDPFSVVLPASLGIDEGSVLTVSEVISLPWIQHVRGSSDATIVETVLDHAGLHPRVVASSDDFNATLRLVSVGLGAALVPQLAMAERPPGVCRVSVQGVSLTRQLWLLSGEHAPADLVTTFVEHCMAMLHEPLDSQPEKHQI